ncbi:hypothetical protein [Streptomyces sp. NBC_01439]|uniref:hypothetical protein n=1 Tax=Streptomyces sp. NBC_01439 TaxID=2903867 RepID=UPI002E2E7723|nr:hypothetical protein [Streptomyces sp. NBC_01439]
MARYRRRLCLAVDLRKYSRHGYRAQEDAQYRLRLVVEHALRRSRVLRVRAQQQVQGDGQLVVFPARIDAVRVIPALVHGLRDGLYQANRTPGAFGRMRMRAALAMGEVSRADRGYLGDSVVLVNRLVDSDGLRGALEDAEGSDLALAVPDDMYRDVILPDGRGLAAEFRRIEVAVEKKEFASGAWLHVPPSAPVRDPRPEPVIWGHSPTRTAMREFVVPALGAAHLAATALSHGSPLREWVLGGSGTGVSYGGGERDFEDTDGTDGTDVHEDGLVDGHPPGRHRSGAHHGSGPHASGHAGAPRPPGPHHAPAHHAPGHDGDPHHHDPHHADPHHQDAHHGDPHHHDPHHTDPHHQDPHHDDPYHQDGHHTDPYHPDPHHDDPGHHDPYHDDPGHHDPGHHDLGHHFHHGGH